MVVSARLAPELDWPLGRFVRDVRMLEALPPGTRAEAFPDGSASMLLRVLPDGSAELSVAGPRKRALFKTLPPASRAILVTFKPGAALPIFGAPLSSLAGRHAPLSELWGPSAERVVERATEGQSSAEIWRWLSSALTQRVARAEEPASALLARRAIRLLTLQTQPRSIAALAQELAVSPRHLRRAFGEAVGVSPKEFARMLRLERALAASSRNPRWSEVAIEAGYYDQPHFIAEFRQLVGMTPSAFSERQAR